MVYIHSRSVEKPLQFGPMLMWIFFIHNNSKNTRSQVIAGHCIIKSIKICFVSLFLHLVPTIAVSLLRTTFLPLKL